VELAEGVNFKEVLEVSITGAIEEGRLKRQRNKFKALQDPHRVARTNY